MNKELDKFIDNNTKDFKNLTDDQATAKLRALMEVCKSTIKTKKDAN